MKFNVLSAESNNYHRGRVPKLGSAVSQGAAVNSKGTPQDTTVILDNCQTPHNYKPRITVKKIIEMKALKTKNN